MKAFRGTLLALLALALVLGAWWFIRPPPPAPVAKDKKETGVALFKFEKSELVKVQVSRPEGTVVLAEKPDGWWIEGDELHASKSMVNRVKHQLHDLVSRAVVVENPEAPALYGLGEGAIHVVLSFRDGTEQKFDAGDPNPSGVSFYLRPIPGDLIYTVKKSAVDYYSLSLSEFRERRFASFDSKDVDALEAARPDGTTLRFQRAGEHDWDLLSPAQFAADDSGVRSLLGRVSAMKAIQFVADEAPDPAKYGLDKPRLKVTLRFSARTPLVLEIGSPTGELDGTYPLTYARLADEDSIYAVRDGLIEDYAADPSTFRLKKFVRLDPNRISQIVATWNDTGAAKDLNGTVTVRMAAETWQWDDGVPVPGSTPKRVATRAGSLESDEFVAGAGDDTKYGLDRPLATLVMSDMDGATRTLLVGKAAPPGVGHDDEPRDRYYARVKEFPELYIVDSGVLEVTKDLMREHRRKADGDAASDERHDDIEREVGPQPALHRPIPDRLGPPGRRPAPGSPGPQDANPATPSKGAAPPTGAP